MLKTFYTIKKETITHQICKIVPGLALHQSRIIAEPRNVQNVALQPGRIGFQHHKNQSWQELIRANRPTLAVLQDLDDTSAAAHHAGELLLRSFHRIHTQ